MKELIWSHYFRFPAPAACINLFSIHLLRSIHFNLKLTRFESDKSQKWIFGIYEIILKVKKNETCRSESRFYMFD